MSPIELYSKEERKVNGVFYTPDFLAEYLVKKTIKYYGRNKIASVLDPACGDGILLRSFVKEFLISKRVENSPKIVGLDNDINAIISLITKFGNEVSKKIPTKFIKTDGLFPSKEKNSADSWKELRQEIQCKMGFDIALSNPPWGADISEYDPLILNQNFSLARGQFDIYNLFVEVIVNNLSKNGVYGLILPDSIFSQEHSRLRCFLARNTTILLIARLGEKIFNEINRACVIVIGSKKETPVDHNVDCFRLSVDYKKKVLLNELTLEEVEKKLIHKVPQSRFLENDNCVFNIDLKIGEQKIFDKIQNSNTTFEKLVKNTRGAEISKKGIVCRCPNCKHWFPYPLAKPPKCAHCKTLLNLKAIETEKIILNHNGIGNVKLKVGEDLYRFTSTSKRWLNTLKEGINYKDLNIYQGEKILVRKTGVGITASLDYENSITNQVVYILKLKPAFVNIISLEFVLAILNSRAMTYYLIKKYGENEWKSHPYLTQTILINLPFPQVNFNSMEHKKLINRVTKIIKSEIVNSVEKNITKYNDLIIERIVAHFFNLNEDDYKAIDGTLIAAGQLIPIRRLLNCNYKEIFNINGI